MFSRTPFSSFPYGKFRLGGAGIVYTGFMQPGSDDVTGTWKNETAGTTLYPSIDEHLVPIDSDYIRSADNPSNDTCRVKLVMPVTGGIVSQPFDVSYRYGKSGSAAVDITVSLKQGSTVIASWTHTNVAA